MSRPAAFCFAALVCAAVAAEVCNHASAAPPVAVAHWKVERLPTKPYAAGAVFTLRLSAAIEPGWHLYALEEPDGGPMPTQIGLAEGDPLMLLKVEEAKPRMLPDPVLRVRTGVFEGATAFTLRVRAPRAPVAADAVSRILVRYQTCNDQMCLPPRTETVVVPLHGVVQ